MNALEVLYNDECQLIDYGETRSGGPYIKLRLSDVQDLEIFRGLDTVTLKKAGHIFNVTIAQGDIAQLSEPTAESPREEISVARILHQQNFFHAPPVLEVLGTDDEYKEWIRLQASCLSKNYDYHEEKAKNMCVAAHVRRASGSGTGYKGKYSCVPLTRAEHDYQHQHGELAVIKAYCALKITAELTVEFSKDMFDRWASTYRAKWGHERLKAELKRETLKGLTCAEIVDWAREKNVYELLPAIIREKEMVR